MGSLCAMSIALLKSFSASANDGVDQRPRYPNADGTAAVRIRITMPSARTQPTSPARRTTPATTYAVCHRT